MKPQTATGIDTYIIKTVEWCNLNCSYCYYYHGQDDSFNDRPRYMPRRAIESLVPKIVDHCRQHAITKIHLTLHGGEPLLQPKDDYLWMMRQFDAIDAAGIETYRKCTTNGVLLDDEWAELLARYRIHLGVSVDGRQSLHDAARVDLAGRGSYTRTVRGLQTALKWQDRGLDTGTITVLNPAESGAETYSHLRSLGVEAISIILPEANYVQSLPVTSDGRTIGDVMVEFFDAWISEDNPNVFIRLFSDMIRALAGVPYANDQFGYAPVRVAVLETDGSLQPTDNFRVCADDMTELGISIYRDPVEALWEHEFFRLCTQQQAMVPAECADCEFVSICGGGRITSRYSADLEFQRKSVHCESLYQIYGHIRDSLAKNGLLPAATI